MKKKYYIKIYAGIGNQLFQYAHGLYLKNQGQPVRFILNRDFTKKNFFDLPEIFCINKKDFIIPKNKVSLFCAKFYAKFINRTFDTGYYQEYKFPLMQQKTDFSFLHQKKLLDCELAQKIQNTQSVSIHIRGGDYLRSSEFPQYGNICTKEYYKNAIEKIKEILKEPVFFVFTNDIAYTQNILEELKENFQYVTGTNVEQDLFFQTLCKANIIANSTFSWWGAFLNSNQNKVVIAPNKWHNQDESAIEKLIPKETNWIRL